MNNFSKVLKAVIMSIASLGIGFAAISLPFRLFDTLSAEGMRYLFIGELTLYFVIGMIFLAAKEKRQQKKTKEAARRFQRQIKLEQAQREYYDFAA